MTGRLDLALVQVSNYLERDLETRSRINQALAYPSVVLGMAVVTVAVLAVWVLPKFATFFSTLGAKLPLLDTRPHRPRELHQELLVPLSRRFRR